MVSVDLEQWLQSLPLNQPVVISGESVYLNVGESGAELGCVFLASFSEDQLDAALKMGFESAIEFDAGWSVSAETESLLLTRWLPQVSTWEQALEPLENLLNQVGTLRAAMVPSEPKEEESLRPKEARIKMKLMRGAR